MITNGNVANHHCHKKGLRDPYSVRGLKGVRDPYSVRGLMVPVVTVTDPPYFFN